LSLCNAISKPLIFDQNYSNNNNDAKLLVSVYGLGICAVNIDDNQEIDQDLTLIYNSSSDIQSIEYNNNEKSIVWLENDVIKKAHFDLKYDTQIQNQKITVIIDKGVTAFGLDWTHNLLYYHVNEDKDIKVIDMSDPNKHKVIISPTKEIVGDIKVDPIRAKIVWSQWDIEGNMAQIMTANQDGTNQTDIAAMAQFKNIISLAIDYLKGKIYFIDKKLFILGSIDYRGNYKITIESQRDLFKFSRSIDVFGSNIYWNFLNSVYLIPTYGNQNYLRKVLIDQQFIDAVKVIDSSKQRFAPNHCLNNICSYLCLPSGHNHYSCVCPQKSNMTTKSLCEESVSSYLKIRYSLLLFNFFSFFRLMKARI
jgi:hypothetical protein